MKGNGSAPQMLPKRASFSPQPHQLLQNSSLNGQIS